ELVCEHFEGKGPVGNGRQNIASEGSVVCDARFAHQGRICRKAADPRLSIQIQHSGLIGPVGEDFNAQIGNWVIHSLKDLPGYCNDSHLVGDAFNDGCDTIACQITAWNASAWGVK